MAPGPTSIATTVIAAATSLFPGGQPIDLIDLNNVKLELGITNANDDLWLSRVITRLSAAANAFCNRVLVNQLYAEQVWPFRDPYPWQSPQRTFPLQLRYWPLSVVPSPAGTAPPMAPALSFGSGAALAARTYYVRLTYVTPSGETAGGVEGSIVIPAGNLCSIAAPGPDEEGIAVAYNVYAGTAAGQETQQAAGLGLGTSWTEPSTGLVAGASLPNYLLAVENGNLPFQPLVGPQPMTEPLNGVGPTPICEGIDFVVDPATGQVNRLFLDGYVRTWDSIPLLFVYSAGFTALTVPPDLEDALIGLVKSRWYGRQRDPMLRSQNIAGVIEQSFALGAGLGAEMDFPPEIQSRLERYRVPVAA